MIIRYDKKIELTVTADKFRFLKGPLGKVKIFLGPRYKRHTIGTEGDGPNLTLNTNYISKQFIKQLQHLNTGLIVGFRKSLHQRGVWTIMKKVRRNLLSFKLGFSHLSLFKVPNHLIFRSRRPSRQFRTINLYSISYQLVADTAAHLLRLRKADVYRLNGFRYALPRLFGPRATNIKLKVGKKK
jgi:ribosomal protein L6P/L9E